MHVIFIAIGKHINPCIASLAFKPCNRVAYRLSVVTKKSFHCLEHNNTIKGISKNVLLCQVLQIGSLVEAINYKYRKLEILSRPEAIQPIVYNASRNYHQMR